MFSSQVLIIYISHPIPRYLLPWWSIVSSSNDVFSRDYVYIDDVVSGIVAAISHSSSPSCVKVFDLGGGKLVTMETLVHLLEGELHKKADIVMTPLLVCGV